MAIKQVFGGEIVKMNLNSTLVAAMAVALISPMSARVAHAQAEVNAPEQLAEVVVTARKRVERLQDMALSVSALSAVDFARRPDVDLSTLANVAPNVIIDDTQEGPGSPAAMTIRGIGVNDHERSIDPTVGVVVDGVFIGASGGAMIKALDLQSVEVLRGPQGTLFGRNSIAGAVNIIRRKPDDQFGGEAKVAFGNYNEIAADAYVNIPVSQQLEFKIGASQDRRDGYFYNDFLNKNQGALDYRSITASAVFRPIESVEVYYRYDKSRTEQDANPLLNVAQPDQAWCSFYHQCAVSLTVPQSGNRYRVVTNSTGDNSFFDSDMHVVNARWDFTPGYKLEYVFGWFHTNEDGHMDFDATPLTLYDTQRPQKYSQHSHEVRLTHSDDGPISYTVGAYLWHSQYRIDMHSYIGFGDLLYPGIIPPGTVLDVPQSVQQHTESYAGFFEGDYRFANDWTFTLGGRYTHDKKDTGLIDPTMPELATAGGIDNPVSKDWSEFTPKASLKYKLTPDVMVYGLYSRGYRAGGFDGRPGTYNSAVTPYNPETVDNLELGTKSEWLDHRLRANADVFFMKYNDMQQELSVPLNSGTGQETLFLNAAQAHIYGFELDLAAIPMQGLTLSATLGLLHARYVEFKDPVTGADLTYLRLRRAPTVSGSLSPSYEWAAFEGIMSVHADYHFISSYDNTFLNSPQGRNGTQNVVDATINYQRKSTTLSIYGRNLTQEDAYSEALDVGASPNNPGLWTFAAPRPPRTWGVSVQQKF